MVTKRSMQVAAGVGVVVAALSIGSTGVAAAMGANPADPTVSSFAATPPSLGSSGGAVTLSADITNATSCTFTSKKPIAGLPATLPCSNGTINQNVTVPANTKMSTTTYKIKLAVTGIKTVNAKTEVTVASGYHVFAGAQWTLQRYIYPANLYVGCTVQTFSYGHRWSDDAGGSGRYTGGAQSIAEPLRPVGPGLMGTWNSVTNDYVGYIYVGARPAYSFTLSPGATPGC